MRKKELKLVVTFHTTADAMAMEKACKAEEVPGRLIPVPRVISAGCGLAWAAPLEAVEQIKHVMQEKGLREKNFMSAWSDLWIQGKMCIFCVEQWSDRYGSEQ